MFIIAISWLTENWGSLPLLSIITTIIRHIASPEKLKAQNFKVQLLLNAYCFCIIVKMKNRKSNHHKWETVCVIMFYKLYKILCSLMLVTQILNPSAQDDRHGPDCYAPLPVTLPVPPFTLPLAPSPPAKLPLIYHALVGRSPPYSFQLFPSASNALSESHMLTR